MNKDEKIFFNGYWTYEELFDEVTEQFQNLFRYKGERYYMGRCEYKKSRKSPSIRAYTVYITEYPNDPNLLDLYNSTDMPFYHTIEEMFNNHVMPDGTLLIEALKESELDN